MKEIKGDAWDLKDNYDYLAITTNGTIKKNKAGVMGRGIALQAKNKYRGVDFELGLRLRQFGNIVQVLNLGNLIMFPVKHNYYEKADIELIKTSCQQLMQTLSADETCLLPRPGCGNGGLYWRQVKEIIEPLLDDRVTIITY